jgi:hypothetical protein
MASRISAQLRRTVERRAEFVCEYCLIHANDVYVGCQVDHVVSEKHDGPTTLDNLALACSFCNRQKGSDIGSIDKATGKFIRLFNPRNDDWADHFRLVGVRIAWATAIGEATVRLLKLNSPNRIEERRILKQYGKYPSPAALKRIKKK